MSPTAKMLKPFDVPSDPPGAYKVPPPAAASQRLTLQVEPIIDPENPSPTDPVRHMCSGAVQCETCTGGSGCTNGPKPSPALAIDGTFEFKKGTPVVFGELIEKNGLAGPIPVFDPNDSLIDLSKRPNKSTEALDELGLRLSAYTKQFPLTSKLANAVVYHSYIVIKSPTKELEELEGKVISIPVTPA